MAPFSMRCNACGEYIYKGKKFNARKEPVAGEHYLGIQIFRFYIRCTRYSFSSFSLNAFFFSLTSLTKRCAAELTFKTDPKNSDYVAEIGVQRNFEPWRDDTTEQLAADREQEEENNPMKALENRTLDSKREMVIISSCITLLFEILKKLFRIFWMH
jgi:hypothetical protein